MMRCDATKRDLQPSLQHLAFTLFMGGAVSLVDFTQEDADVQPSWFQRLLLVTSVALSELLSNSRFAPLFDRRFCREHCGQLCDHPECQGRFGGPHAEVVYGNVAHRGTHCAKNIGHSGECACIAHCPRIIVDIQVYRPWIIDQRLRPQQGFHLYNMQRDEEREPWQEP